MRLESSGCSDIIFKNELYSLRLHSILGKQRRHLLRRGRIFKIYPLIIIILLIVTIMIMPIIIQIYHDHHHMYHSSKDQTYHKNR